MGIPWPEVASREISAYSARRTAPALASCHLLKEASGDLDHVVGLLPSERTERIALSPNGNRQDPAFAPKSAGARKPPDIEPELCAGRACRTPVALG
jgi:hypothetical protein